MSLNDPLDAFLESHGEVDSIVRCEISTRDAMEMPHTLLWHLDPENSLSDWRIILESSDDGMKNDYVSKKYDQEANYEEDNNDGEDDDEITPLTTTFYVHRSILASVSTYFQSLFKKRKYNQTSEHQTQTSTIKLHSQAIKAFPVFLDYLYNFAKGRLGFKRSNAVALRHLAIYFGVDTLLKDISELILLDFQSARFRTMYCDNATLFNDEKLLHGIKLQRSISKTLFAVATEIYSFLYQNAAALLEHDEEEENGVLSSWRLSMTKICETPFDTFFTFKNSEEYPDVCVIGAGLGALNGIYKLCGCRDGVGAYTNGICCITRDEEKWEFVIHFHEDWLSLYECVFYTPEEYHYNYRRNHTYRHPPCVGWTVTKDIEKYSPAPTIILNFS